MKRPAFQFYPADWTKDLGLRMCSLSARGMWLEMLCMAHEAEHYGRLVVAGCAMTDAQIVASIHGATNETLTELEAAGVFSRDATGAIYSRRMVRDEHLRATRAAGGVLGAEHGIKGGRPKKEKPLPKKGRGSRRGFENNPPSSSSSTSLKPKTKPKPSAPLPVRCPVDADLWDAFRAVRRKKRAAETEYAEELLVRELEALQTKGHDPTAVVEQSVRSGWTDVYPLGHKRRNGREPTPAERKAAHWADIIGSKHGHTIDDLDRAPVRATDDDLRQQQDGDDVARLPKGRPPEHLG